MNTFLIFLYAEFIDKLTYHHTSGEIGILKENDTFTIEVVQNSKLRKKRSGKLDIDVNIQPIDNSPPVLSKYTRNELYAWIGESTTITNLKAVDKDTETESIIYKITDSSKSELNRKGFRVLVDNKEKYDFTQNQINLGNVVLKHKLLRGRKAERLEKKKIIVNYELSDGKNVKTLQESLFIFLRENKVQFVKNPGFDSGHQIMLTVTPGEPTPLGRFVSIEHSVRILTSVMIQLQ